MMLTIRRHRAAALLTVSSPLTDMLLMLALMVLWFFKQET